MKICFGSNEYILVPGSTIQINPNNEITIQLLADNVNFEELETVLKDKTNTENISILDDRGIITTVYGYSKLINIYKVYNVLYKTDFIEHEITPQTIDPQTGEMIPAVVETERIEHHANIFYIHMTKPDIEKQIEENTANIEFIAIMSDIEL